MNNILLPKDTPAYAATEDEIEPSPAIKVLHPHAAWVKIALGVLFFWIPK